MMTNRFVGLYHRSTQELYSCSWNCNIPLYLALCMWLCSRAVQANVNQCRLSKNAPHAVQLLVALPARKPYVYPCSATHLRCPDSSLGQNTAGSLCRWTPKQVLSAVGAWQGLSLHSCWMESWMRMPLRSRMLPQLLGMVATLTR